MRAMGAAKNYQFTDTTCLDYLGNTVTIPDGIYSVAELDSISISISGRTITLTVAEFTALKADRRAVLV